MQGAVMAPCICCWGVRMCAHRVIWRNGRSHGVHGALAVLQRAHHHASIMPHGKGVELGARLHVHRLCTPLAPVGVGTADTMRRRARRDALSTRTGGTRTGRGPALLRGRTQPHNTAGTPTAPLFVALTPPLPPSSPYDPPPVFQGQPSPRLPLARPPPSQPGRQHRPASQPGRQHRPPPSTHG